MKEKFRTIQNEITMGLRTNGDELTQDDIGKPLALGWGEVLPVDVGKKVWTLAYGLTMENCEQRDKRKDKEFKDFIIPKKEFNK